MNGLLGNAAYYLQRSGQQPGGLLPAGPASFQGGGGGRTLSAPSGVQALPSKYAGLGEGLAALGEGISGAVDTYKANQEAEKQKAQWQSLFAPTQMEGGPTVANAATAPIRKMLPNLNPQQIDFLQKVGPEKGMPWIQSQVLKEPKDPAEWDQIAASMGLQQGTPAYQEFMQNVADSKYPRAKPEPRKTGYHAGKLIDMNTGDVIRDMTPDEIALRTAGRATTNIINPPSGYRPVLDEQGQPTGNVEPIPGGPVDLEMKEAAKKEASRKEQTITSASDMLNKIDRASAYLAQNPDAAGLWGSIKLKLMPGGTTAHNLKALIDPIKASLGFQELQTMRENSPTGGALGGIAVAELDMLQATISSLDQIQDPELLQEALQIIRDKYAKVQRIINGDMTEDEARAELEAAGSEGGGVTDMQQSSPLRITIDKDQNAMPTGSVYIGKTSDGKPVFQSPNGKRFVGD